MGRIGLGIGVLGLLCVMGACGDSSMQAENLSAQNEFSDSEEYHIRSATQKKHYLFVANEEHVYGKEYDVRTHQSPNERRNRWIIEKAP